MKYIHYIAVFATLLCSTPTPLLFCFMPSPDMMAQGMPEMPQLSEEEIAQLTQQMQELISNLSPEEKALLDELANNIAIEMGLNPNDMIPPSQLGTTPFPTPSTPIQQEKAPEPVIERSDYTNKEIQKILAKAEENLSILSTKAASEQAEREKLLDAQQSLINRLFAYVKLVQKPEHYERFTSKEFAPIISALKELNAALDKHLPNLVFPEPLELQDDPYETLGVDNTASQEEIDQAYKLLATRKDPIRLKKRLEASGKPSKDIERAVKDATVSFEDIKQAYQKIKEPNLRTQYDRSTVSLKSHFGEINRQTFTALGAIIQALEATDQKRVLPLFEDFLKKYEPQELAYRKNLAAAEAERKKEQQAREQLRPRPSPASATPESPRYDTGYRQPEYQAPSMGYQDYHSPHSSDNTWNPYEFNAPSSDNAFGSSKSSDSGPRQEMQELKSEKKKEDKEKEESASEGKEEGQKKEGEKKEQEQTHYIYLLMREIEELLLRVDKELSETATKKMQELEALTKDTQLINDQRDLLFRFTNKLGLLYKELAGIKNDEDKKRYQKQWDEKILSDKKYQKTFKRIAALNAYFHEQEYADRLEAAKIKRKGEEKKLPIEAMAREIGGSIKAMVDITNSLNPSDKQRLYTGKPEEIVAQQFDDIIKQKA